MFLPGVIFAGIFLYIYYITLRSAYRIAKGMARMAFPKPEPKPKSRVKGKVK